MTVIKEEEVTNGFLGASHKKKVGLATLKLGKRLGLEG